MSKIITLSAMLLVLIIYGCGPSDEPESSKNTTGTAPEKIAEDAKTSVNEVKKAEEVVAEKSEKTAAEEAEETKEVASQTSKATREVYSDVKETNNEAADKAVQQGETATIETTKAAGDAVAAVKEKYMPETIVLEASYGNVTLPHAQHAGVLECVTCHGDKAPGPFELDKDQAHDLCKGCHKVKGAGPTTCKDCHKK